MFLCDCGLFFCDVRCTRRSACPHIEELHLPWDMLTLVCAGRSEEEAPECRCLCCTERFGLRRAISFVGDSVDEGIELQVQGMRWLLGRKQERVIWCGAEKGNRSLRDVPKA